MHFTRNLYTQFMHSFNLNAHFHSVSTINMELFVQINVIFVQVNPDIRCVIHFILHFVIAIYLWNIMFQNQTDVSTYLMFWCFSSRESKDAMNVNALFSQLLAQQIWFNTPVGYRLLLMFVELMAVIDCYIFYLKFSCNFQVIFQELCIQGRRTLCNTDKFF